MIQRMIETKIPMDGIFNLMDFVLLWGINIMVMGVKALLKKFRIERMWVPLTP